MNILVCIAIEALKDKIFFNNHDDKQSVMSFIVELKRKLNIAVMEIKKTALSATWSSTNHQ